MQRGENDHMRERKVECNNNSMRMKRDSELMLSLSHLNTLYDMVSLWMCDSFWLRLLQDGLTDHVYAKNNILFRGFEKTGIIF